MTRTRLRPKHRRALLAALPPLAAELRDGRLVALAADLLADRNALAPPSDEVERLAAEAKEARDEAALLRRELQDRRAEVARLQAAVASPEGSGIKRRLRTLEQALAEAREGARADAAAADSAIALLDAVLAGLASLLGEGPPPAEADLPLGAVDLLVRLRARLAASEPAHAAER